LTRAVPEPPLTRRSFANVWGELDYLCTKIRYWLYARKQKSNAERYLHRLDQALHQSAGNDLAILREEGLALLAELRGEVAEAVAHRRREIELMKQLHREARSPGYDAATRAYLLHDRELADLQERRAILERLEKAQVGTSDSAPGGSR
jgi:hypothetical protein